MLTTEQLAARKIGGSDVGTILGLNPWKTALELYAEIKEEIPRVDLSENEAVEAGVVMEDAIADLTARRMTRRLGREVKLRRCNLTLTNPKYPWITCHIDRDVVGEERGVEIKNVGARAARFWGEEGTDEIPEFQELIVELTHDFWHKHVLAGIPPPFDPGHAAAERAIKRLYPGTNGATLNADAKLEHWRSVFEEADELQKQYAKSAELAKCHLLSAMGEAAFLKFGDGCSLTRKRVERKPYTVEATSYIDARIKKPAKEKE